MKKIIAFALVLCLALCLVACGGPDKQPAIDAFNKASAALDKISITINADPESYDEEVIDTMIEFAELMMQYKTLLEGEDEIPQENLDQMVEWFGTVETWAGDLQAELGIE